MFRDDDEGPTVKRAPTMDDVAAEAGVSRALVSLVMRDSPKVSDARRAAVLEAAERLGYRPNVLARNLASHRTMTIGVLINDLHNPYFADVVDGLELGATEAGYRLLVTIGWRDPEREAAAVDAMLESRVDGIVLLGPMMDAEGLAALGVSVPIVSVGRRYDALPFVGGDEELGARLAVEHLVGLGHRRIVHLGGGAGAGAEGRRVGYRAAMEEAGLGEHVRIVPGTFTEASGIAAARLLLDEAEPLPTAVFAANDLIAMGALGAFEDAGLEVPGDISVMGYDNSMLSALAHSSLTTVDQPREALGRAAMAELLGQLSSSEPDPDDVRVTEPHVVVRSTTGPAR